MKFKDYIPIIFGVLKDLKVIGTLIVMLLVIAFTKYIINYTKKPKKPKVKKAPKPAPAPKTESEGGEESDEATETAEE